jgi:hypothetical protein
MTEKQHYISIWFFIGALLGVYGVLILAAGIYGLFVPPKNVALSELHPGVWWGAVLIAIGSFYTIRFRPRREELPGEDKGPPANPPA